MILFCEIIVSFIKKMVYYSTEFLTRRINVLAKLAVKTLKRATLICTGTLRPNSGQNPDKKFPPGSTALP